MVDEQPSENSQELEFYGEFGLLPKVGVKLRFARNARLQQLVDSASQHAELSRGQLDERLVGSSDRVRNVVLAAAHRATEVDDDDYIDALGRLIAGALDSAEIDELAFFTSEVTKLDPVHLRGLLGFFWFGREGSEAADPNLSPVDASWATNRFRADREIASLLKMTSDSASQVLHRLDREGLIHLHGGPATDGEKTSGPSDWAGRVVSVLFRNMTVEFRSPTSGSSGEEPVAAASTKAVVADSGVRDRRSVIELEAEIKKLERQKHSVAGLDMIGGDPKWLATLKRRLRKVDPDNPWAYDD